MEAADEPAGCPLMDERLAQGSVVDAVAEPAGAR